MKRSSHFASTNTFNLTVFGFPFHLTLAGVDFQFQAFPLAMLFRVAVPSVAIRVTCLLTEIMVALAWVLNRLSREHGCVYGWHSSDLHIRNLTLPLQRTFST